MAEILKGHASDGCDYCACGHRYSWTENAPGWNAEWADHAAEVLMSELGLTQVWSDDVAGPDWQRYSYWRTPTESHPGPSRLAAGLT